jgi:hypothetical protein
VLVVGEQVFIVHRTLVSHLLGQFIDGTYCPILIDFPSLALCSPSTLIALQDVSKYILRTIEEGEQRIIIKPSGNIELLPSVAGLLLSYPAIYHSRDLHARLVDMEVNVFSVRTSGAETRVLMQFSSPLNFQDEVMTKLTSAVAEWELRISQLSSSLQDKWLKFTGVESCTLTIQLETRRVPVICL